MPGKPNISAPAGELAEAGREFYRRGWVSGTSGNFSMLLARKPLRICVTASGIEKGNLDETNFLELDDDAEILQGFRKPAGLSAATCGSMRAGAGAISRACARLPRTVRPACVRSSR